ncbi:MAG: sulfotransferase family 2 domain-containing protein [Anaerolineae bacterium]|nr:sulfotransferase family 2 domain-containing protein [Anaerolineae bacterium]
MGVAEMVISHEHKYLFVELPLTGSTAVREELCAYYDGVPILTKHSSYSTFVRNASSDEKEYFVFSCIRNPLDTVVSHYFKLRTNHWKFDSQKRINKRNILNRVLYRFGHLRQFRFIQDNQADFPTFFLKFYTLPYDNWSSLDHQNFDVVIRFERLSGDFAKVIELIGLEQQRSLPVKNKTSDKASNFWSYYDTPTVRKRAKSVFMPFMNKWGYNFPADWEPCKKSWLWEAEFESLKVFRNIYWRYLKHQV